MAAALDNLKIETAGTEEEAADQLEVALEMNVKEARGNVFEGKDGGDMTQGVLRAQGVFTQDSEPSGTTLVDARNGFNELIRLALNPECIPP